MNVICEKSALKHGLTEEEIATAFEQSVKFKNRDSNRNGAFVRMVIGVLPNGKTCELIGFFQLWMSLLCFMQWPQLGSRLLAKLRGANNELD